MNQKEEQNHSHWCNTFGHILYLDTGDDIAGSSTCKLCGHVEPAITWLRTDTSRETTKQHEEDCICEECYKNWEEEARKIRKRLIPSEDKMDNIEALEEAIENFANNAARKIIIAFLSGILGGFLMSVILFLQTKGDC